MLTVNYIPDPDNLPQLTEEEEAKLANLSDEQIDYSDIAELNEDFWETAEMVTPNQFNSKKREKFGVMSNQTKTLGDIVEPSSNLVNWDV